MHDTVRETCLKSINKGFRNEHAIQLNLKNLLYISRIYYTRVEECLYCTEQKRVYVT